MSMKKILVHLFDSNGVSLDYFLRNSLLHSDDIKDIERYKVDESKKEKAVSYIFKRRYIGDFHLNEYGKPLSDKKYFNIAHSKGVVVYVEDENSPIGIDIEKIRAVDDSLKRYISNEEEYSYIKDDKSFFEIWTNKESLTKTIGIGLTTKVKDIPSLPIRGAKTFNGENYYTNIINYKDFIISICFMGDDDFELEIVKENI